MIRRPGDTTPEPSGGRAAERLRMFEDARRPKDASQQKQNKKPAPGAKKDAPTKRGVPSDEKQDRRKD